MATQQQTQSPLGVCVWDIARYAHYTVAYPQYVYEMLDHAGLCYERVAPSDLAARLPQLRLLLTIGESDLPAALREQLAAWVAAGGAWISVGGVCGLGDLLGVRLQPAAYRLYGHAPNLGEGYLHKQTSAHPVLDHVTLPLHYFGGVSALAAGGVVLASALDAHQRPSERVAVVENRSGDGRSLFIAPDVTGTVVRIQQGTAIARDGVGAPDGTAPVGDSILKTDDGLTLDWIFDRQPVDGAPGLSAFMTPIADLWRELLLRAVFHLAQAQGVSLPVLWYYPRNLAAIAEFSHDTDGNDPQGAWNMLDVLRRAGVHSTWCVLVPGYPPEVIDAIGAAGHELAMHYDAFNVDRPWCEANWIGQRRFLTEQFGGKAPITNKNHYLRWQGDSEYWEWCARGGVQLDQSKGPSKTGACFFTFGTCHPYLPVDTAGRFIDVLELPTLTQDLLLTAPVSAVPALIHAVMSSHGVLHLLFHPAHIHKPGQADAFIDAARQARAAGLEWWTAAQINAWERARRQTRLSAHGGRCTVQTGAAELPQATLLWLGPRAHTVTVDGTPRPAQTVQRWGFTFQSVVVDLRPETTSVLEVV